MELPIDRLLNLVYFWATRNAQDEQTLAKFDRKLWMPPKGEEPPAESPWSAANETSAFQAFKAQIQPYGPAKPEATTTRSEEHTSELHTLMRISYAIFCLNKKNTKHYTVIS